MPKYQTYMLNERDEIVGTEKATHADDAAAFDRAVELLETCQAVDVLRGARLLRRLTRREYGLPAQIPFARRRFSLFNASPTPRWLRV